MNRQLWAPAVALMCLLVMLPGCTHDTGAEVTEFNATYAVDVNRDWATTSFTVYPRDERYNLFGSEYDLVSDAAVQINFEPVDFDAKLGAFRKSQTDFVLGTGVDLDVTFDARETYRYAFQLHDLELTGMPDISAIYLGDLIDLEWTAPSNNTYGTLEVRPKDPEFKPTFIDGRSRIWWEPSEDLRNKDIELIFTVRRDLPAYHGFEKVVLRYEYTWAGRVLPE